MTGSPAVTGAASPSGSPLDLLVENARIVDVVRLRLFRGWLGVRGGRFAFVEEGEAPPSAGPGAFAARQRLDAGGAVVQPGLIDTHMHIESSLLTPRRFAEAVLPWGTTTVLQDPHELANVLGAGGVEWMLQAGQGLPLRILTAIPSCVPATSDELESSGARITADDVAALARRPGVVALGELMDYQGLVRGDRRLAAIVEAARQAGLSVEGHVPTLAGPALSAYAAWGIRSDHTLMTAAKVGEELSKGMYVMLQEKSLTPEVVGFVAGLPDRSRVLLVTDDVLPNRLVGGHLNRILQRAVELGWDALDALASATVRPATYLGLRDLGVVAPGFRADFLVCDELNAFPPRWVYVEGARVAEQGQPTFAAPPAELPPALAERGRLGAGASLARVLAAEAFRLTLAPGRARARVRVIRVNDADTFTTLEERTVTLDDGIPAGEPDLALATVIPRTALRAGRVGPLTVGLIAGLNLQAGAFATSFAHDSHNLFVVGRSPQAMAAAVRAVAEAGGGMAVAGDHGIEVLPLPFAGLLSDEPAAAVAQRFERLERALRSLGMTHRNPILLLTIMPLTVSPAFKLSDQGVVDVENRRVLPPVIEPGVSG